MTRGFMAALDKTVGSSPAEEDGEHWLPAFFKTSGVDWMDDLGIGVTLGLGTFGRVRLAESSAVKEHDKKHAREEGKEPHGGYFAVKILKKSEILRLNEAEHVKAEHDLLLHKVQHPFIVDVYACYHDERNLYMIMEYVPGGEVLAEIRRDTDALDNDPAKFYAAQLVMALQYLHGENIIYRGLNPENLLIDAEGYLKLVDFGLAKKLPVGPDGELGQTYTLAGTADYLAPEVINSTGGKGHGKGADWWALGVVIYEMLAGYAPFNAASNYEIYQKALNAKPTYPSHFDKSLYEGIDGTTGEVKAGEPRAGLLAKLMHPEKTKRIGCLKDGAEDVKKHKWFRGLNWAALYNKQLPPPRPRPPLEGPGDHSCFTLIKTYPDSVAESGPVLEPVKEASFAYWDYPAQHPHA